MSGFALIFDSQEPITPKNQDFVAFKDSVAHYKQLNSDCAETSGLRYVAAKFDTPSTLHRGITVDEQSGSWMLAVGTVLSNKNDQGGKLATLLTNYLKQGNSVFENLDGHFALVIYNKAADELAVVSDPLGLVSVFYAHQGSRTYVTTSALAVAKAVQATPSKYGTLVFLMTGNVFDKYTLWQDVERLTPGTVLEISQTGSAKSVYWSPVVQQKISQLSLNETIDYSFALLSQLTRQALEREGTTWADFTGGFDSRLVTMIMDHCSLPFKACCQGPIASPDVRISSRIAQELGWAYQHNIMPDNWGYERYEILPRALGKGDGHLDIFKASMVIWDQDQRALEYDTSVWGAGGEMWRGTIWKQEYWNTGKSPTVNYDRLIDYRVMRPVEYAIFGDPSWVKWIRGEVKALVKSVGDRYLDFPNTVKLDCIFAYKTTGHTGAHISAVMGQQRVLAPLYFKSSVTGAISTHFKWRNHSRLVRSLMEKINPVLAGFETTAGGPALPMRVTNIYKFIPYWLGLSRQLIRKTFQTTPWRHLLPATRDEFASYPLLRWRRETLDCLEQDRVLDYAHMHSGRLYNAERLADFIRQARSEEFSQETLLSRIVTVEMALRSVGASF